MNKLYEPTTDIRVPADSADFETTQSNSALPPLEFKVTKGTSVNTFTIQDRQFVAKRGATASYRIYFLPAAFISKTQPPILGPSTRVAGQKVASIVTELSSSGRGQMLTAQDSQFFGKAGAYYCVGVNRQGLEAPPEHMVSVS